MASLSACAPVPYWKDFDYMNRWGQRVTATVKAVEYIAPAENGKPTLFWELRRLLPPLGRTPTQGSHRAIYDVRLKVEELCRVTGVPLADHFRGTYKSSRASASPPLPDPAPEPELSTAMLLRLCLSDARSRKSARQDAARDFLTAFFDSLFGDTAFRLEDFDLDVKENCKHLCHERPFRGTCAHVLRASAVMDRLIHSPWFPVATQLVELMLHISEKPACPSCAQWLDDVVTAIVGKVEDTDYGLAAYQHDSVSRGSSQLVHGPKRRRRMDNALAATPE